MDLRWQDIRLFYVRELRGALRERGIIVNSILIPLLLYPIMLWLMFLALTFARGQEERFVSRLAWVGEARPAVLEKELGDAKKVEWLEGFSEASGRQAIRDAQLDLLIAAEADPSFAGNLRLHLVFDASKERSAKAHDRLLVAAGNYRGLVLESEAQARALSPEAWQQVHLQMDNVSTDREMGAFILGLIGPMLMVFMIGIGTFYPAVDSTAGERERSTWETTFTTAASRASILFAKFLYVASMGLVAALLNLAAMAFSLPMILAPLLEQGDEKLTFAVPWTSLPLVVLAAALLALAMAAAMMILATFARTFKEGQSMVAPVYMLSILPAILVSSPDLQLTAGWALVPVANIVLLFRDAITGVFNWPLIGLTLLVQAALVFFCLFLARQVLRFEEVMIGSYGGNFQRFLKEKLMRSRRASKESGA